MYESSNKLDSNSDIVSIQNFPTANIFRPMLHTDQALFFGEDLIILKSPMSGILFIQIVKSSNENTSVKPCNFEFRPIKTIKMCQGLYKDILKSDFEIFQI